MTTPEPQSTVPVEPLTAEEERQWRDWLAAGHLPFGDGATNGQRVARLLATLDAARASAPVSVAARSDILNEPLGVFIERVARYPGLEGWLAALPVPDAPTEREGHICANHDESLDEAYRKGLADAATLPATPTGIDAERLAEAMRKSPILRQFMVGSTPVTYCRPFKPDYDWTSTCPHDAAISECPDGDDGCRCECHAVPDDRPSRGVWRG